MYPRSQAKVHENHIGLPIILRVYNGSELADLSNESDQPWIDFRRPDRTAFRVTAEFYIENLDSDEVPGSNGHLVYYTQDGDLVPAGEWYIQGYIPYQGQIIPTHVYKFIVYPNIQGSSEDLEL